MRFYKAEEWLSDQLARVPRWGWLAGLATLIGGSWLADWLAR